MENKIKRKARNFISLVFAGPVARNVLRTTVWASFGKAAGLFVPFFIAAWYGVSRQTDAFFFAYSIILFFSTIFIWSLENPIVPFLAQSMSGEEDVGKFVGTVLSFLGLALLVFIGFVLLFIRPVLSFATSFDAQSLDLVYGMLRMLSPLILILVLSSVLTGTLNAYEKFTVPAITPAFRAATMLLLIMVLREKMGIHALGLGYLAGESLSLIILFFSLKRKTDCKLRFAFEFSHRIRGFFRTVSYQVAGTVAVSLNPVLDKVMASWLGEGNVTVLYYAYRLYMVPVGLICMGLVPVLLSYWSKDHYQGRGILFQRAQRTAKYVLIISSAVFAILIFVRFPLIRVVFLRGEFDSKYFPILQWTFFCYLLGLVPFLVGMVFSKVHLVLKDTALLMRIAIFGCVMNVTLNYILMRVIGVAGIALATSISSLAVGAGFFWFFHKKKARAYV